MAYEHKDGQGSMFKNEKTNERQPDYKGTILINGKTYDIAGWRRTSRTGTEYLSLQASEPSEARRAPAGGTPQSAFPQSTIPQAPLSEPPAFDSDMPLGEDLPFDIDLPF